MEVEQVVEVFDQPVHQASGVDLAGVAVGAAGHDVVDVYPIGVAALLAEEGGDVHYRHADYGAAHVFQRQVFEQALDDADAVQLVSVDGGGQG